MLARPSLGGFATQLDFIRAEIRKAALGNGRDPASITLVAVTKTFPAEAILPALERKVIVDDSIKGVLQTLPLMAPTATPAPQP